MYSVIATFKSSIFGCFFVLQVCVHNHQVHTDFLIILYNIKSLIDSVYSAVQTEHLFNTDKIDV
jgi:hypothetical protein